MIDALSAWASPSDEWRFLLADKQHSTFWQEVLPQPCLIWLMRVSRERSLSIFSWKRTAVSFLGRAVTGFLG